MQEKTPDNLMNLLNELALIDIGLFPPVSFCSCKVSELPSDLKSLLKLSDSEHSKFISGLHAGEPEIRHKVKDFDLTQLLEYYDEEYPDFKNSMKFVKGYFSGRPVDVAIGKGKDRRESGFAFDWVLVLDNKTLFSFILNLED